MLVAIFIFLLHYSLIFLAVEYGIGSRVVIHLHLLVGFHLFAPGGDVGEQLTYCRGQINAVLKQHVELSLATCLVLLAGIGAFHLLLHVINLKCQNRESVDGPSRALGVDCGIFEWSDIGI